MLKDRSAFQRSDALKQIVHIPHDHTLPFRNNPERVAAIRLQIGNLPLESILPINLAANHKSHRQSLADDNDDGPDVDAAYADFRAGHGALHY
jgi:hypothetical protein